MSPDRNPSDGGFAADDRGVSIAVTHVLTIGITTILIGGLIVGAGGLLDGEQQRAADRELTAVGEGIAAEMVTVAVTAEERDLNETSVRTNHPRQVTGESYTVELTDDETLDIGDEIDGACAVDDRLQNGEYDACLVLQSETVTVEIPLNLPSGVTVTEDTTSGGNIVIEYNDGDVTVGGA